MVSVVKYNADEGKLVHLPYYVPTDALAGMWFLFQPDDQICLESLLGLELFSGLGSLILS